MESTGFATDRYELTMVQAALGSGVAHRRASFEVFTRRLPQGRRFGVVAGTDRVLDAVERFRFSNTDIEALQHLEPTPMDLSPSMIEWLLDYRFTGDIVGYEEGELFGPYSPILTVTGTFAEAVVLETVILSILNHDCAIAAAAASIALVAGGARLIEMGSRRTDPDAAVAAARSSMIGGFSATSNLEAGRRYGVATAGTAAHSFTLAHESEADAFRAQVLSQGTATTLLVDTYDIAVGIHTAVAIAKEHGASGPGAIRIDSGDLGLEAKRARELLDELGATTTRIVLSGDLDGQTIASLVAQHAPVDAFGVGTSVVTGDGHPTAGLSYKLVEIDDHDGVSHAVAKRSAGKASLGGTKHAFRVDGTDVIQPESDATTAQLAAQLTAQLTDQQTAKPIGRPVQVEYVVAGEIVRRSTVDTAARRLTMSLEELGDRTFNTHVIAPDHHG